jgi:hypothetical protein
VSKILGQDGTGWTLTNATDQSFGAGAFGFAAGYVPLFNGNVTSFNVLFGTGSSASTFQVCLFLGASPSTGGATLLVTSASGTVAASTLVNVSCAPTAVSTANTYTLFLSTSSGSANTQFNSGASAFADSQYNSTHFPFATPPATTFNPRDAGTGHEFVIWADGAAAGPTAYLLNAGTLNYGYNLGNANPTNNYVLPAGAIAYNYTMQPQQLLKNGQPFSGGGYGKGRRRFHRFT